MAHHANTQIQQHSVGPIYPFVIYRQEMNGHPSWGYQGAGFFVAPFWSYDDAYNSAKELKESGLTIEQARREEAEHWEAFREQDMIDAMNGL